MLFLMVNMVQYENSISELRLEREGLLYLAVLAGNDYICGEALEYLHLLLNLSISHLPHSLAKIKAILKFLHSTRNIDKIRELLSRPLSPTLSPSSSISEDSLSIPTLQAKITQERTQDEPKTSPPRKDSEAQSKKVTKKGGKSRKKSKGVQPKRDIRAEKKKKRNDLKEQVRNCLHYYHTFQIDSQTILFFDKKKAMVQQGRESLDSAEAYRRGWIPASILGMMESKMHWMPILPIPSTILKEFSHRISTVLYSTIYRVLPYFRVQIL